MVDPNYYYDDNELIEHSFTVNHKVEGHRLDRYVVQHIHEYSRSFIQKLIRDGRVTVNGKTSKVAYHVEYGDAIHIKVPTIRKIDIIPQDIKFDILYEDDVMLAILKPPGLIIHPGTGRIDGTLANGLAYYFNQQAIDGVNTMRVGIVHRIDKDTTGVLLVAKTPAAHTILQKQFQARTVKKEYITFVNGVPEFDSGHIDKPIGHDRRYHTMRNIRPVEEGGKESQTDYEVLERFEDFSLVKCLPRTGRTHQIRVHMKAIHHTLMIDETYGHRKKIYLSDLTGRAAEENELPLMDRLTLHAYRIHFIHPGTEKEMTLEAPLPDDMRKLLDALRQHCPQRSRK